MKAVVIPPHGDLTLTMSAPAGWTAIDCEHAFIARIIQPGYLEDVLHSMELQQELNPRSLNRLLLLQTACVLLRRSTNFHTSLRAIGMALEALSTSSGTMTVTLDDLEIADGSTERSLDILHAIEGTYLFAPEIEAAVEELKKAECVRLIIDRDQHLPGALAIASQLTGNVLLELCGQFASEHRLALRHLPFFANARIDGNATLPWKISSSGLSQELQTSELFWQTMPHGLPPEHAGRWAGYVPLQDLVDYDKIIASGSQTVVVGFCHMTENAVIAVDGTSVSLKALQTGTVHLHEAAIHIVAEWYVGSPGSTEEDLLATLRRLNDRPFFDWLAGLRLFQWPIHQQARTWGGIPVTIDEPEKDRDLARSRPFTSSNAIAPDHRLSILQRLASQVSRQMLLSPGRVAGAYLHIPERENAGGQLITLDPDCAIVTLPASLDGRPGRTMYAVNVRTRSVLAVDERLARPLTTLEHPVSPATALAMVPDNGRERIYRMLIAKNILKEVGA